ncbi:tetratricopeptide repeat protein [Flavobacterium pectinovorum]|uniref:tetratricopeptide repeat protein n=1 Tax=Flavobacterium pectinovorum TaxID=29533 RepID=UPI0018847746|nr:tetratricopeptide repeat protein [Flavobacterium pectinovorum]
MNVTDYTYLMNKPDAITEKQADALGSVLNEFPYFQSARALRLKGLYNQNSFKYNYALKVTAAYTTDRSILFDFITSETFTSIQSEYYDRKLKDLLNITVFDSEIISAEQIKKSTEVRIDPIEQSILDSIKEATTVTFEKPVIIEEPKIDLVIEQPVLDSFKEVTTTFEEPVKIKDLKIESISEQSILDSFKEVISTTFEETPKIEEPIIEPISEQAILDSFKEVTTATFEETPKIEELIIEPISEQSILDSFKEITTATFEEPIETEEIKIEPVIEQPILDHFKEVTSVVFEEPAIIEEPVLTSDQTETNITFEETPKIEEIKVDPIIEQPVKIATSTFFDETVDDEIPDVRVDPIEKSILNSIKEASTVVFEKAKEEEEVEEPNEIEIPEVVKTAEENLEIGKPLDFSVNEKHSFQEWLQLAKTEPIDRSEETPEEEKQTKKPTETIVEVELLDEEKKKKAEIINKFIETNPKISPIKQTAITPAVQFNINQEDNSYLMTETLARVYLEQKKYTKAIQAYEILILKYPEKISFFADRISDIKILQQNNNNN